MCNKDAIAAVVIKNLVFGVSPFETTVKHSSRCNKLLLAVCKLYSGSGGEN